MLFLLYGPDTYRSRQKLKEIVDEYRGNYKSGLNLKILDFKDEKFEKLQEENQSISLFKEKKLVILKNAFSNQEFKEKFLKETEKFTDLKDIILFYEEKEIALNDSLLKFLKEKAKTQEFQLLTGQKLKTWVKKEFEKYGFNPAQQVIDTIIIFIGSDSWHISNEIQKLAAYKSNKKNLEITLEDVKTLVKPQIDINIFKTVDAFATRNKKDAFRLIHKQIEDGENPSYLLSMINFQFRNLLIVKSIIEKNKPYDLILKISGLHPFVVSKSYEQAKRFTLQELKKIYQKIFQVDLEIKTGKTEPQTALDLLIAEI